ncbi:large neutral amino acids transporter small subunit 2-like isoform X3 [Ptychodera flava]|uniref:large neutral amino acids transporter small subunit 2-like isoform X3 n=1 Tax=Ptychodera flava TaxID=63121 RepID=UPI00396A9FC1
MSSNGDEKTRPENGLKQRGRELQSAPDVLDETSSSYAVAMKRQIGLFPSIMIIMGSIIGSGIFVSPKGVLEYSGSVGGALLVWTMCGVIATLGGMCYAELGSSIGKGGGEYTYLNEAFGEFLAFLMLWVNFIIVSPGNTAIIAQTFAIYAITPFYSDCDPPPWAVTLVAEACILLIFGYNCYSVKGATWVQNIFTVAKVIGLGIIIMAGIVFLIMGRTEYLEDAFEGPGTNGLRISLAFYSGLFAYTGWAGMNNMAEEIVNPHRNFPIAAISSMTLITVIYVLTNIAYFTVLSPQEMLASNAVAVTWGELALGSFAWLMPVAVAMSTFGAVNGAALTNSRYTFVAARDGLLPSLFSMIHIKYLTPLPTLVVMMLITMTLCLYQDTGSLINYTGFSYWLFVGIVATGLVWMRYRRRDIERPFTIPL